MGSGFAFAADMAIEDATPEVSEAAKALSLLR